MKHKPSSTDASDSKLRITILQGAFFPVPPVRGGAVEKLWHRMAIEFAGKGHQVTHISRAVPELPPTNMEDGIRHLRVPGYDQPAGGIALKWRDYLYTRRALRAAPEADILITNTFFSPLLARPGQGRIYVSVERMPKGQMRLYRRAARLRACSRAVGDAIKREAPALQSKVIVVPNPLPFVPNQPVDPQSTKKDLLFVGRIHPAKGVELLLKAFCTAKRNGEIPKSCRLIMVGPADSAKGGGGESWWQKTLSSYPREDIRWLGPIYQEDLLNKQYRSAAALVYPTLDEAGEAMPVTPLEAMAWGCVPVVSDLACFRDYLVPQSNGFVFDHRAADPVKALATALGLALSQAGQSLSIQAVKVRETHAPAVMADHFIRDFRSILTLY